MLDYTNIFVWLHLLLLTFLILYLLTAHITYWCMLREIHQVFPSDWTHCSKILICLFLLLNFLAFNLFLCYWCSRSTLCSVSGCNWVISWLFWVFMWIVRRRKTSCSVCCVARRPLWTCWVWPMSSRCRRPMTSCLCWSLCWSSLASRHYCQTFSMWAASMRSVWPARNSTGGCSLCRQLSSSRRWITLISFTYPFYANCYHMGTAIKHSVPDRVKPSFVIFDIRTLWRSGLSGSVPRCQKLQLTA